MTGQMAECDRAKVTGLKSDARSLALRPDLVEEVLVLRQQPALDDLAVLEAVQPVAAPGPCTAVADGLAGRDDHAVFVVGQHVMDGGLEGPAGQRLTLPNVRHDLVLATVRAGDRAPTRNVPHDLVVKRRSDLGKVTAGSSVVLAPEQLLVRVHA